MKAHSLRLRLLVGAAALVGLALIVAGGIIAYLFTANVERAARSELSARLTRLVAAIDPQSPAMLATAQPLADPRYETPLAGAYWQIVGPDGATLRSRSLWDTVLDGGGSAAGERFASIGGPGGQSLSALSMQARFATPQGEKRFEVTVAEDRAVLDAASGQFGRELAVALAVLGAALVGAAWLQVRLGLKPLDSLREGIGAIRRDAHERVPGRYPAEVMPLVAEVDELLASQRKSMEFARARASDLAHGLKTPLSVMAGIAERLRENGDAETATALDELSTEMADRIDYQLRLSRLRLRTRAQTLAAPLDEAVRRTVAVLQKTRDGERLDWRLELEPGLTLDIDKQDLIELVGVLLENAAKWSETAVQVTARRDGAHAEIGIADDGPGIAAGDVAQLGSRGQRLDEAKPGNGLGLAIAREIIALNDGTLTLSRSTLGGLGITIRLPLAGGSVSA